MAFFIQELNELLQRPDDLPTLPDVVFELHAALEDENIGQAQVADIIDRDPALTAKLLRVSNSALFNTGAEISTVYGAIQRLGMREVRVTCIVLSVVKCFTGTGEGLDHREFWNHSAAVGLVTRLLWRRMKKFGGPLGPDDIYVAGLLHDVGLLMLDQYFPDQFKETLEVRELSGDPLWQSEDLVLGMDHGEIGGLLLGRWQLPEMMTRLVSCHHHPETGPEEVQDACRVVHVAEEISTALDMGVLPEGEREIDVNALLLSLGFGGDDAEEILEEIEEIKEGASGLLQAA